MSDLVKWAIKIGIAIACIALVVTIFSTTGLLDGLSPALNTANQWLTSGSSYLVEARKLINIFVVPQVFTILFTTALLKPLLTVAIKTARYVVDTIYGKND